MGCRSADDSDDRPQSRFDDVQTFVQQQRVSSQAQGSSHDLVCELEEAPAVSPWASHTMREELVQSGGISGAGMQNAWHTTALPWPSPFVTGRNALSSQFSIVRCLQTAEGERRSPTGYFRSALTG